MRFAHVPGITAEWSDDHMVMRDAAGEVITTLNPVGALMWDWLPADLDSLVDQLQRRFPDVDRSALESDTQQFLVDLQAAGLIGESDTQG